ncbi:nicotinamide riboside transporter PnuC [Gordonia sp. CPCC 206044]|uniref:nicotinamide riboside transporter PnuC n=1 Tax=Gordonia sp. CPCC 206044 TaxID=3140793 RepID=UPI003AF33A9A
MLTWLAAHWAEILGFVTGAGCVLLAARRNVWTFPLGIANNIVFIGLFTANGIYANVGLQVVYLLLGIHGWRNWLASRSEPTFVLQTPRRVVPLLVVTAVAAAGILWWVLDRHTDSTIPFYDAVTTSASLVAQYMLNRRWLQNWFVWIAVDVVYVGMYAITGLPVTAALYMLFIVMCVLGYLGWRGSARAGTEREPRSSVV